MPIKRDAEFVTSGARGWAENYADDGDLFIRIGNLTRDSIRLDLSDTQRVVVPNSAEVDRTQVQAGDILFSITAYLGSTAVVPIGIGRAFVSQHVALVRLRKERLFPDWPAYVAISYIGKTHLETAGYGGTKVQLSLADVTSLPMVVPPLSEQAAAAAFLDHKTVEIDALINEAQLVIAFLQERRTALVSAAVTGQIDVRNWEGRS
jgi:type I restriction enzyme S subunit